jgi:hypothetical protein
VNAFLVALHLIVLHSVDGREISVNPQLVTSLHAAKGANKLLVGEARCVVSLADGKFVSVIETCDVVRQLIEGRDR